MGTRI
jgi:hypothetical protein